jgi:hypothetical protein
MGLRSAVVVAAAIAAVAAPSAGAATFAAPLKLTGASGGEPSIATDEFGHVYVSGPQGIPAAAGGNAGGVGFWVSADDGNTFPAAQIIGSSVGGGDSDIVWADKEKAIYVADLEAAGTQICESTKFGAPGSFTGIGPLPDPNNCTSTNGGQAGPSNDREWLSAAPDGTLYLTYHEFVSAQPVAFRSDNGGADDFANSCGPLVTDPAIEANVPTDITGGTLVSKPVVDSHGNLYVLFVTTTQQENALGLANGQVSGTFSQLYLAVSKDRCQSFTDYTVYDGEAKNGENATQFGNIFNDLAIDGAGNLYAIADGYIGAKDAGKTNVYLFRSTDGGQHWSSPVQVGSATDAHMMPAAVGGPGAGQLAIGYYRTVNGVTDPNATTGKWTYGTAESSDATAASPTFTYTDVAPGVIYHYGDICNQGILCGIAPGGSDRSLADFTSAALDTHGCPLFTFAANPTVTTPDTASGSDTFNYVTRQTTGCFTTTAPSGSTGGGTAPPAKPNPPRGHRPRRRHKHHRSTHKRTHAKVRHHHRRPHRTDPDRP